METSSVTEMTLRGDNYPQTSGGLNLLPETPAEAIMRMAWAEVRASTKDFLAITILTAMVE